MNKILVIAKREYRAAVRTKGFIISLVFLPVFMGGGLLAFALLKDKVDLSEKKIAVVDNSGLFADYITGTVDYHNKTESVDTALRQVAPFYRVEMIRPDSADPERQMLELSNRVRAKDLHAFITIGKNVLHPQSGGESSRILYFAENSSVDNVRSWFNNVINNRIRELRALELGVDGEKMRNLFYWVNAEAMGLLSVNTKTGEVVDARRSSELQTILVPYIALLLMFMMIMSAAVPLLTSVMEEKSERIAEVLLGTVTPTQFMAGKVLGSLGVSFTTSAIYIAGIVFTISRMELEAEIPYDIIPWFFVYLLLNIIMIGSVMAAMGATCNDSKDAQAIQFPLMLPIILPLFLMMPIIINPLGKMATVMSLIPLWTPMLMLLRQSTSVTIPVWQTIAGLAGVVIFTILCVWAGARIFRSAIILQGKRPPLGTLIKYILKG